MKIAVTRCDGDTEIIVLNDPVKVYEGSSQAHIHSAEGMDHYFRLSDGCYDGLAMGIPTGSPCTQQQAESYLEALMDQRKIIPLTVQRFCFLCVRRWYRKLQWWKGCLLQLPGYPK